jgi:chemotaxis protein MotB
MLCFFVLIYAMSSMDDKKFEGAFGVLTSAFGAIGKTEHAELKPDPFQGVMAPVPEFLVRDIKDMLQRHVRDLPEEIIKPPEIEPIPDQFRAMFEVERVNEGVEVLIAGKILFDESGYKLLPASIALLQEIGGEAAEWAVPVRVEAYVNPTGKNRDQAWDLGVYRAAAVTNVLSGVNGLDPTLLSMMGYGRKAPKCL